MNPHPTVFGHFLAVDVEGGKAAEDLKMYPIFARFGRCEYALPRIRMIGQQCVSMTYREIDRVVDPLVACVANCPP